MQTGGIWVQVYSVLVHFVHNKNMSSINQLICVWFVGGWISGVRWHVWSDTGFHRARTVDTASLKQPPLTLKLSQYSPLVWIGVNRITDHVIGATCHYDVIDFVSGQTAPVCCIMTSLILLVVKQRLFVAKRRDGAAWQQIQNQWRHNGKFVQWLVQLYCPITDKRIIRL